MNEAAHVASERGTKHTEKDAAAIPCVKGATPSLGWFEEKAELEPKQPSREKDGEAARKVAEEVERLRLQENAAQKAAEETQRLRLELEAAQKAERLRLFQEATQKATEEAERIRLQEEAERQAALKVPEKADATRLEEEA